MKEIFKEMENSFKLRILPVNRDCSNLERTACCGAYFIEGTDICSVCGLNTLAICKVCDGSGDVVEKRRISPITIDIPYVKCPECFGSGKVEAEHSYEYL